MLPMLLTGGENCRTIEAISNYEAEWVRIRFSFARPFSEIVSSLAEFNPNIVVAFKYILIQRKSRELENQCANVIR